VFSWSVTLLTFAFLLNNFLTYWAGLPGASASFGEGGALAFVQLALYPVAIGLAFMMVRQGAQLSLREEAGRLYAITAYIIRWAFFSVLLVGFADALISFLRVEGILENVVGAQLTSELGRPKLPRALGAHSVVRGGAGFCRHVAQDTRLHLAGAAGGGCRAGDRVHPFHLLLRAGLHG
jgi:hypothetical protein